MLFNSFEFLVFLPIVFILYWYVFKNIKCQNLFIVIVSYIFYGWWNWKLLFLIALTSACSYGCGIAIERYEQQNRIIQKWISTTNIILNLSILGTFKYYNFFVENLKSVLGFIGWNVDFVTLNVILPVGISFYTFQALSYTIDVYRGSIKATHNPIEFFAYISFFPQLVAGPIERARNLLPQFQEDRQFCYAKAVEGCQQMLWGFFKKVVIADNCAYYANIVFDHYTEVGSFHLLLGAIFFSFQIYGDFSGYSSIAIGCAKLFGINLQANFRVPYFSRNIAEFWKRWHISLNKWFVDYVYIPLGGSRTTKTKVIRNVFIIFLLSGLWHGPNWTYVGWGLYHACLFLPLILLGLNKRYIADFDKQKVFPTWNELISMSVTFLLVTIGWIIFRSSNIHQAYTYIYRMFQLIPHGDYGISIKDSAWLILSVILMVAAEWKNRFFDSEFHLTTNISLLRYIIYIILIGSVYLSYMISIEDDNTFIYFQF